jgi:predicted DsbA family dithiol-disulfide isomerase
MKVIEVFADVSCPFAHVGLNRVLDARSRTGSSVPAVRVRAWPLELVNGVPLTGAGIVEKVDALRSSVAPDLFSGFDPAAFPTSTVPLLAAEAAAHDLGAVVGERFSVRVRELLFEQGVDPSTPEVFAELLREHGIDVADVVLARPGADHSEGVARGVQGSPHFFAGEASWFCPSLHIAHDEDGYDISFDSAAFEAFAAVAFA